MTASNPGFFSTTAGKLIAAAVGVVFVLSVCLCAGVVGWFFLLPGTPKIIGDWASTTTIKVPRDFDPDPDNAIEKSEAHFSFAHHGTGSFQSPTGGVDMFKWKDFNPSTRTFTVELADADKPFWRGLKSPMTFEYKIEGKSMTLTPVGAPDKALTFTRIDPEQHFNGGGDRGLVKKKIR
jgi:hypothetical protein